MNCHRFSIYGLTVEANVPLPGVARAADGHSADVRVTLRDDVAPARGPDDGLALWYVSPERDASETPWLTVWRGADYCFAYSEGARFHISADGAAVEGSWCPPLAEADAVSYLLGPVLAFVLRLRGVVPLHASGVVVDGQALLFAGPPGAGKSSTVAALGALGHAVLSDDLVPLEIVGAILMARPGFPRVSVWEDTATAVLGTRTPPLQPWSDSYAKRCLDLDDGGVRFCPVPRRVAGIYVLGPRGAGAGLRSEPLRARDALVALAANTYGTYLLDRDMREREFAFLGQVAQCAPVLPLQLADDLRGLRSACEQLAGAR